MKTRQTCETTGQLFHFEGQLFHFAAQLFHLRMNSTIGPVEAAA